MHTNIKQALAYTRSAKTARAKADHLAKLARANPRFATQAKRAATAAEGAEYLAAAHTRLADQLISWREATPATPQTEVRKARAKLRRHD